MLAKKLMEMIGRGQANISGVTDLARAALHDCVGSDASRALDALASCGQYGNHPSNEERDFHTWTRGMCGLELEPYTIMLTLHVSQLSIQSSESSYDP